MELENTLSPAHSSKNLLFDFSIKQSANYPGQDVVEDPSFFRQCSGLSMRGMDLSEMSIGKIERIPAERKPEEIKIRTDSSKPDTAKKAYYPQFSDEERMLSKDSEIILSEVSKPRKSVLRDSIYETKRMPNKSRTFSIGGGGGTPNGDSSRVERSSSIKSYTSKKSRTGSFFFERQNSENTSNANKQPQPVAGRMTFVGLVAMARKMGLLKRNHAYEDYMSKDQFNMIKDLSTGRFDAKEEKRTEQMTRLKTKLLMTTHVRQGSRVHRKRTHLMEWKNDLVPTIKRMYNNTKKTLTKVIAPNGTLRVIWDMYTMLLIFYDLIMVPLTISFDVPMPDVLRIWDKVMTASFFLDICFNFDTGFYYKGMLVMDRNKIIQNYLKGWFWIDLLASFPYVDVIPNSDPNDDDSSSSNYSLIKIIRFLKFIKILRFIRVFKLKNLFVKLESYIDISNAATSIIGFLKLSLITLFIAHWLACIWHFISVWELETNPETWITRQGVLDADWVTRYVSSIYWATTTMITVGYGDIVPITVVEKLIAVIAMLVASAIFAYTMNRINVILDGLETTSEQYQKALATITGYMRKKRVKKELQIKIKKYLEYALEVETSLDSNEEYLNAYLNQSLKNELILEIHGKILLENEIFSRFDNSLIMKTSLIMKERIFSPEDPVFLETENDDASIYIIHSGRIEIFNFKSNSFLKTLTKGNHFGEYAFFTGIARSASARSTDFSAVYLVVRNDFIELLNEFPLEKEKFHEVKDKLSIYQDQSVINARCYSCDSPDHIVNECPKVHVVIPKTKFIQSYIERRTKFMNSYIRTGQRSSKKPERYRRMVNAAKQLQVDILEGECQIDKSLMFATSNFEVPEFSEHPSALLNNENKFKKIPTFSKKSILKSSKSYTVDRKQKNPMLLTCSTFELESGGNGSGSGTNELAVTLETKKTPPISFSITTSLTETKDNKKKYAIEGNIDKVQNFTHYFPHNNFELLFPPTLEIGKSVFDYFSQSDTGKDTIKRFISILKERVRIRKENTTKEHDLPTQRSSTFHYKNATSNIKSKFYRERPSFSGPSSPARTPRSGIFGAETSPRKPVMGDRLGIPEFNGAGFRSDKSEHNSESDEDSR